MRQAGLVQTGNVVLRRHLNSHRFPERARQLPRAVLRAVSEPPPLIASSLVIAEGHGWFLRRYDQELTVQFLVFVDALPKPDNPGLRYFRTCQVRPYRKEILGPGTHVGGCSWAGYHVG